jgi:TrmH family RNA methyltransferase
MRITSRDNSLLKRIRSVRNGEVKDRIFIEGMRLTEEAILSGLEFEAAVFSEEIAVKPIAAELIKKLEAVSPRLASVSERLMKSVAYTTTPQGIATIARRPRTDIGIFEEAQTGTPLLVVLHGITNPGNVGAILRTAEAAGVTGVIATANTTDPFAPKSLRGAMGSAFRLPIWHGAEYAEAIEWCHKREIWTACADVRARQVYADFDWRSPSALVLGHETGGFSADEVNMARAAFSIPMRGEVESLNVAVAGGIILYEAARQRAQK